MSSHAYVFALVDLAASPSRPPQRALEIPTMRFPESSVSFELLPAQLGSSPHVVASVGMLALALLGGGLLLRNRLETDRSIASRPEPPREEFKTDREKVCELVDENGGRMKQSEIVDSVDWSKAKVSRLLADLEDDEQVTKLRLGRENLICLPGHEPTASKSADSTNTG